MTTDEKLELVKDGARTVAQAVAFSGIGRTRLYELMEDGTLPFIRQGNRRLIPVAALKRLLAESFAAA